MIFQCQVTRKHILINKTYTLQIYSDQLQITSDTSHQPKYIQQINLKSKISWKTQDNEIKCIGLQYKEKIKWFSAQEKLLLQIKQLLSNKIYFGNISTFYKSEDVIGSGASCKVIAIVNIATNIKFAAKCISKEYIHKKKTSERLDRLENEIVILRSLNHQNIVKLYEIFEGESSFYLVFEHLPGDTLYRFIKNQKVIKEPMIKIIMSQILRGMKYLHDNMILHRDIKLENLMFTSDNNQIKIIDFGLAINLEQQQTYAICGTPGYIAPEILQHEEQYKKGVKFNYTDRIDMFGVGVLLYRMITKQQLFESDKTKELILLNKRCYIPKIQYSNYSNEINKLLYGLIDSNCQTRFSAEQSLILLGYIDAKQSFTQSNSYTRTKTNQQQEIDEFEVENSVELIQKPYFFETKLNQTHEIIYSFHQNDDIYKMQKSYLPSFSKSIEGSEVIQKQPDFVIEK